MAFLSSSPSHIALYNTGKTLSLKIITLSPFMKHISQFLRSLGALSNLRTTPKSVAERTVRVRTVIIEWLLYLSQVSHVLVVAVELHTWRPAWSVGRSKMLPTLPGNVGVWQRWSGHDVTDETNARLIHSTHNWSLTRH